MAAPEKVAQLVEVFARNIDVYKTPNYNETQVRREFIDPLFEAPAPDVSNTAAYKDVIHEDAIKVGAIGKVQLFIERIDCEANKDAVMRVMAVIKGFYDGALIPLKKVTIIG